MKVVPVRSERPDVSITLSGDEAEMLRKYFEAVYEYEGEALSEWLPEEKDAVSDLIDTFLDALEDMMLNEKEEE